MIEDECVYDEKLSEKMKRLENETNYKLERKKPVILRIDGRSFSKFTKNLDKPFDKDLSRLFQEVTIDLHKEMDNVKFIYSTSDEISILMTDWINDNTEAWYNYRLQKLSSIASSVVTAKFNKVLLDLKNKYWSRVMARDTLLEDDEYNLNKYKLWRDKQFKAMFDCRVFNLEKEDVVPYFIYRQKDAIRNSISSLANAYFSHKTLEGKNQKEKLQMVKDETGIDWNKLSIIQQRGFAVYKRDNEWIVDGSIPEFMIDRQFIEQFLI